MLSGQDGTFIETVPYVFCLKSVVMQDEAIT